MRSHSTPSVITVFILLFVLNISLAQAQFCQDCSKNQTSAFQEILQTFKITKSNTFEVPYDQRNDEISDLLKAQKKFGFKHTGKSKKFGEGCEPFLSEKGEIGKYGKLVVKNITRLDVADVYFNSIPKDFTNGTPESPQPGLCPNFGNMNVEQKKLFWVWFFKSFADFENSCQESKQDKNQPYNKTAASKDRGMLQLNTNSCGKVDLTNVENTFDCGTRLLAKEIRYRGTLTDAYNSKEKNPNSKSKTTYWGPLRIDDTHYDDHSSASICNARNLRNFIREFPLCGATKKDPICFRKDIIKKIEQFKAEQTKKTQVKEKATKVSLKTSSKTSSKVRSKSRSKSK